MVIKGRIDSFGKDKDSNGNYTTARCCPMGKEGLVTRPLTLPFYLRGRFGNLHKGTEVVYVVFPDETGIVLERMDGEWIGQRVPGTVKIYGGDVEADTISLKHHVHGGVDTGPGKTGEAE